MRKAPTSIVQMLCLGAIAWSPWSSSDAKEVPIPVQVVVTQLDNAKVRWEASVPNIQAHIPELNAGDRVTPLKISGVTKDLGTWERTYRRFSHEHCRTSWFRKKCTRYYANDTFKRTKNFDVPSAAVALNIEFERRFPAGAPWHRGKYPLALGKPIDVPGPLEMTIKGGVETDVPQAMDGAVGEPVDPVRLKMLVGKDGPAPWFTLVVVFDAAPMVNSEEK